ncbi:hypothetical protein GF327_02570 [Candidatus Woesearchaeota archaeon]|nr:hypothetical protein [Candidatus Woesearchaeota archaeon]
MVKVPESMEDLIYWTNRKVGKGHVKAWVYRGECPECKKGMMGKPTHPSGKVKVRAKIYVCDNCDYEVDKEEYEDTLDCECIYTCPKCEHKGEATFPYQRKTYKGAKALVFKCSECEQKIPITKKMKKVKL